MGNLLTIAIYGHPEAYPPTLNAIRELAKLFDSVHIVYRPVFEDQWEYPENVHMIPSGDRMTVGQQEGSSLPKKILYFIRFTQKLRRELRRNKPAWLLLYDGMPTLSYYLIRPFLRHKPKVWYHNHDVYETDKLRKHSLAWFAHSVEKKFLGYTDIFSLPAVERKAFFDLSDFKGHFAFLPNFPSLHYLDHVSAPSKNEDELRLIFQGSIGTGHGIEQILDLMPLTVNGRKLKLVLKGFIKPDYEKELKEKIASQGIENDVIFIGLTPYQEIANITAGCDIGIAIFTKNDKMNMTLGTASNKIYEYAACGLPILYFDVPHFEEHLGKFDWAYRTDLSPESLRSCLNQIASNLGSLSASAKQSYLDQLHYELYFDKITPLLGNIPGS